MIESTGCNDRTFNVFKSGLVILAGIAFPLLSGCATSKAPDGPVLNRVAEWDANPQYNVANGERLCEWVQSDTPVSIIHTPEDRYPNDLAVCMAPFLVDWVNSDLINPQEGYVIIHNVGVGGNPLLGINRHASIRIPINGIERVEYVIVRSYLKGPAKTGGHIQLRFVFHEDKRPVLLAADGNPDYEQPFIDDLIMSWEGWRPTETTFSMGRGLDPEGGYELTCRLYAGGQRFLNDALKGGWWDCYPLKLPDHEEAADYVLFSGLIMGDSVARRTIGELYKDEVFSKKMEGIQVEWTEEDLDKLRGKFAWDEIPEDKLTDVMKETDISYHTFNRSCISVTLWQIEAAMVRLFEEKGLGSRETIVAEPGEIPKWFDYVREGKTWKTITRAPGAIFWIMGNSELLPYKAWVPLKEAGMLELNKKGKPVVYRYGHKGASPYGKLRRNLM